LYLNSGDWVENRTALEYAQGEWALMRSQQLLDTGRPTDGFNEETRAVV
jgi:hypothetical protein